MRSAELRGREHTWIGCVATVAEGPVGISLSRGGARKRYAHARPNEDVAAFARGEGGVLLAVADGHSGCEASETAVAHLIQHFGKAWTGASRCGLRERWSELAADAMAGACTAIQQQAVSGGCDVSRTTLVLALLRPDEDTLAWASLGDSHVFAVDAAGTRELAPHQPRSFWLGHPAETPDTLAGKLRAGVEPLAPVRAVVLASDGLSEQAIGVTDPVAAVDEVVARSVQQQPRAALRPLDTARAVAEAALRAHRQNRAGDNIAAAVWLA